MMEADRLRVLAQQVEQKKVFRLGVNSQVQPIDNLNIVNEVIVPSFPGKIKL